MNKDIIKTQIVNSAGNVVYTYVAHWKMAARLKKQNHTIKIVQIALTSLSSCGILASIIGKLTFLGWLSGIPVALSLALNLYMLNFHLESEINMHTDAANALWKVREEYKSLIVDLDLLSIEEVREKRDYLMNSVDEINKKYPGTDDKSFAKAKKEIGKYIFGKDESIKLLNL